MGCISVLEPVNVHSIRVGKYRASILGYTKNRLINKRKILHTLDNILKVKPKIINERD